MQFGVTEKESGRTLSVVPDLDRERQGDPIGTFAGEIA